MADPRSGPQPREQVGSLASLVRHSLTYSAVPLLSRAIGFALLPFLADWLGTARFGLNEIADMVLIGLQQLLGQNLLSGMTRFYFDQKDERDRKALVSSTTLLVGALAWAVCGTALLLRADLAPLLLARGGGDVDPAQLPSVLALTVLIVPFQLTTQAGSYYLQILQRSGAFARIQVAKLVLEVCLKIWLIAFLDLGVRGFLLSVLAGEVLTSTGLYAWMLARVGLRFDWRVLRPALAFTLPLVPVGLMQLGLHQLDRRLLEHLSPRGPELALVAVGIYGLGYKIGYLVNQLMLGPFLQIWMPWIYAVKDERERGLLVSRVSTYAVIAIGSATLAMVIFGRELIRLVDLRSGEFTDAWRVLPWVAAGYVFWALYQVAQTPLFIAKRTGRLVAVNAAALAFNVVANVVLVPRLDEVGAAIASLATFALIAGLGLWASRSVTHSSFEVGRLSAVLGCVVAGSTVAWWLDSAEAAGGGPGLAGGLALKAAALAGLLGLVWAAVLHPDERERLRGYAAKVLGRAA